MKAIENMIGKKVLIRSSDSGVHYGTLTEYNNGTVHLKDSRRLWEWHVASHGISLTEVAIQGIDHKKSRITDWLPDIIIIGVCEIIPTHGMAEALIEGAPVATG